MRLLNSDRNNSRGNRPLILPTYLFFLRVPSGGMPIRRAALADIITTKSPQPTVALMGIRFIDKSPRLILKLKKRNLNKTGGDNDASALLR